MYLWTFALPREASHRILEKNKFDPRPRPVLLRKKEAVISQPIEY